MRKLLTSAAIAYSLIGSGCSFVGNMYRNVIHDPILGCDQLQIYKRNRAVGDEAFVVMTGQYGCDFSPDYRCGFVDGFADYLTYGGCVEGCGEKPVVPPVPPEKYRRKQYMTPAGYQAMEDWFAGFRHGANTAQASGLRQLIVLPVITAPKFGPDDAIKADYKPSTSIPGGQGGEPPLGNSGTSSTAPDGTTLPAPRTLPAPDGEPAKPPATPPTGPPMPPMTVPPAAKPAEHPF